MWCNHWNILNIIMVTKLTAIIMSLSCAVYCYILLCFIRKIKIEIFIHLIIESLKNEKICEHKKKESKYFHKTLILIVVSSYFILFWLMVSRHFNIVTFCCVHGITLKKKKPTNEYIYYIFFFFSKNIYIYIYIHILYFYVLGNH